MQILILLNTHIQLRFLPFYFYFKVCSQDRIRTCIVENLQNQYLCHLLALPIAPPDLLLMLKDTEKVFSIQKAQEINLAPFFVYQNMFYFYINPASVKQFFIKSGPNESHLVELSYDISLF